MAVETLDLIPGTPHRLRTSAAAAYARMRAAGCPPGITSSSRTEAYQWELYRNQGRPGWPARADHPARSKHVWRPTDAQDRGGRALDLPEPARAWVRANGHRFGWAKDRVPDERWHFEHETWNDPSLEDDMPTPAEIWAHPIAGLPAGERLTLISNRALAAQQNAAKAVAETAALKAMVEQLAAGSGVSIDYAAIEAAIQRALAEGVDLNVTATAREPR